MKESQESLFERDSPNSVAEVFEFLFPDANVRDLCAHALADSVTTAHSRSATNWSITLTPEMIRLNVGKIEVLTFVPDIARLTLDEKQLPHSLREHNDAMLRFGGTTSKAIYRSVPTSISCDFPADSGALLFPLVRACHDSLITAASATSRSSTWARAYSPGVVEYLSKLTGRQLLHPAYYLAFNADPDRSEFFEGAALRVTHNIYERDPRAASAMYQSPRMLLFGLRF